MENIEEEYIKFKISKRIDIEYLIYQVLRLAKVAGFREAEQHMAATAASELSSNILRYAIKGEVIVRIIKKNSCKGIEIIARDKGPGIEDIEKAMQDNFSTSNGLGVGLPGVKRLMGNISINSKPGKGTIVKTQKWVK